MCNLAVLTLVRIGCRMTKLFCLYTNRGFFLEQHLIFDRGLEDRGKDCVRTCIAILVKIFHPGLPHFNLGTEQLREIEGERSVDRVSMRDKEIEIKIELF